MVSMSEKRKVPRVPVDLKVALHQGKQVAHGQALQFSEYGMLVGPAEVAQVGQRYDLLFNLPGQRNAFRVRGVVVYATGKGVGIRFESVPPEVTNTFRTYLTGLASSQAPTSSQTSPI